MDLVLDVVSRWRDATRQSRRIFEERPAAGAPRPGREARGEVLQRAVRLRSVARALIVWLVLWLASANVSAQRSVSVCPSLETCQAALIRGAYADVERDVGALRRGATRSAATLILARVRLETGRYESAANLARPLSRRGAARVEAAGLLADAELARGRLDQAQRALESVADDASAHRARVMLARLLIRRGQRDRARPLLHRLIGAYNDGTITERDGENVFYVALAAQLLNSPNDANDAYQQSSRADPRRVETQLAWARLFLSKYAAGPAEESVAAALTVNPNSARAHAMMARVRLDQSHDFVAAEEALDRALAVNPNLVMAHVTRAAIAVRDMELDRADEHLDRALAIDPTDLEALSVRAATRFLANDDAGYRAAVREVLRLNPRFSELYSIVADHANWEHRYIEIVDMARAALRIDPEDARAHATLGINLLRTGDEEAGLAALREAWRRDRFNVYVRNLIRLFDDVIATQYETIDAAPFVFRIHRDERPIMERYMTDTLRGAYRDMRRRYGFTPRTPIHIEAFSEQEHFSVRTSGLPNIGVQGVCFGQLITALSPRAGPFNWAQITWHELAHVFHLQMSNNRVPRWFTEGLAEYETMIARPEWQREQDHRLRAALEGGGLPPLHSLNHAFTHARNGDEMTVAYYASTMVVKYIAERWSFTEIAQMLRAWGRGLPSDRVVRSVLGISEVELDRAFREHTRARFAQRPSDFAVDFSRYRDLEAAQSAASQRPNDPDAHAALAAALLVHRRPDEARAAIRTALMADRDHALARFVAARVAMARRDVRTALADIRLLIASGHDGYQPRLLQARLAIRRRWPSFARSALEAAARIDPRRIEAWQGLLALADRSGDQELRLRALRRIVDLDQHDREHNQELLAHAVAEEDWARALAYGERSVLVDPLRPEARRLYAEALLHADRASDALLEADAALAASPREPGPAHLTRARVLARLRRPRDARAAARAAVVADPSLRAAAAEILPER